MPLAALGGRFFAEKASQKKDKKAQNVRNTKFIKAVNLLKCLTYLYYCDIIKVAFCANIRSEGRFAAVDSF